MFKLFDDPIALLLVFLLEPGVFSSKGVLKLSFIFHHLFEVPGHEGHFIIYGSLRTII